ncbi:MAG: cysteine desulfurase family protein [Candidatus Saccharibacteria bacterium]|uniref:Cysteine desulfurase IscS n=1 Tax=Candidatus Nanosyncoccus alces TaxID=2171997 RepID=A0ABY0FL37_9BACT|nr:cysteine desulfurase family protein [Candidatus Nanosyncoccus alces]MDO4398699.1 cysteine desulfurase family protein [Candidatus Saccharibacteria bacterium]RYC74475.1 Cysteine desulfurase IscS [Candidatus Nanosyncoccus alces]
MIYLDHAAATPVSAKALKAMEPYFATEFFNPSAAYLPAKKVAADYEAAKDTIAHAVGAKGTDLVITAGATEANNLAFTAVAQHNYGKDEVLYLETEHDSVRAVAQRYGGKAIRVLSSGLINLNDLKTKITDETKLISVSLANNELGTIQPLAEVAAIIKEIKIDRYKRGIKKPLYLHSDASQALNLLDINVARLGVDMLTISSAKIYGPKGIGALYVSHGVKLSPLTLGGGQEKGLRSGTENVPGVIGFATAAKEAKEHLNGNRKKYKDLKRILLSGLQGYELINKKHTLDNFIVLCYNGVDAERLIYLLEDREIYVATGAACAASKGQKSHVLTAIGLNNSQIAGSLRLTLGETNTAEQIHEAARIINETVAAERKRING